MKGIEGYPTECPHCDSEKVHRLGTRVQGFRQIWQSRCSKCMKTSSNSIIVDIEGEKKWRLYGNRQKKANLTKAQKKIDRTPRTSIYYGSICLNMTEKEKEVLDETIRENNRSPRYSDIPLDDCVSAILDVVTNRSRSH